MKKNMHEVITNILVVLGAGASKSMEGKDKSGFVIGINSGHKEMPLGDGLIKEICKYDAKSLSWILASAIYQIKCKKYFTRNKDFINPEPDFLEFAKLIENHFPEYFSQHGYFLKEEIEKIKNYFEKLSPYFDPKLPEKPDSTNIAIKIGISISVDIAKDDPLIAQYFQESYFIKQQYTKEFKKYDISPFARLVFFEYLVLLLSKNLSQIKNETPENRELFYKSLYHLIERSCINIVTINNINHKNRSNRLSGNEISPHSVYSQYANTFDRSIEVLKDAFADPLQRNNFFIPSLNDLDHLKQIFLVSKLIQYYKPQSIDYFMLKLDFFAPYEFWDIQNDKYCELDDNSKNIRKELIQKHTKFIISNILINAATGTYYDTDPHGNDYINKLIWIIGRASHLHDKEPSIFAKENFKIVTFNYESLAESQMYNRLNIEVVKTISENTKSIYGKIFLKSDDNIDITMTVEDGLWNSIFLSEGDDYFIKAPNVNVETKYFICKNIFEQLSSSIKWIGECSSELEKEEKEKDREEILNNFNWATDVYFLGFGFDLNNLYQIGLINKKHELQISDVGQKKIYVSGGNAKIINIIKTIFRCDNQEVITTSRLSNADNEKPQIQLINHLYRIRSKNIEFIISDKLLPEALDDFEK